MAAGVSLEILDLRHFAAPVLRPVLDAEGELWSKRLHWDYRSSARLLMQYLDNHLLPGYAALEAGQVTGYTFCVYEETKAVIGDVFAMPGRNPEAADSDPEPEREIEATLLKHLFETLLNSPNVDRIESQLLLHPSGTHAEIFLESGFELYGRHFMVQPLAGHWSRPRVEMPPELELRPWRDDDLNSAARLISTAYYGHPDSLINDQYRSVHGSMRFLHNIVRYSGCGVFSPQASCGGGAKHARAGCTGAGIAGESAERAHNAAVRSSEVSQAGACAQDVAGCGGALSEPGSERDFTDSDRGERAGYRTLQERRV